MKKKKLLIPILIIVIAITIILCERGFLEKNKRCEEKVKDFLTAFQMKDKECGKYLLGHENEPFEFNGYLAILAENMKFEINYSEKKEDSYIVHVVITNVDFGAVFEGLHNTYKNQPDSIGNIQTELENRLRAKDAPVREFEVPVEVDNEMKIIMTSDIYNALFGGFPQYLIY